LFIRQRNLKGAAGVETIVCEEWGQQSGGMLSVVVRELCERKWLKSVVLLIITEHPKILFQDLGDPFCLTV